MTAAHPAAPLRPARFGLAAKLFAILILLGAVAVLITGVLGYVRARDALERTIFAQLTAARTCAGQLMSPGSCPLAMPIR